MYELRRINSGDRFETHGSPHLYIKAGGDAISFRQITLRRFLSSAEDHFSFGKPPHLYFFTSSLNVCVHVSFSYFSHQWLVLLLWKITWYISAIVWWKGYKFTFVLMISMLISMLIAAIIMTMIIMNNYHYSWWFMIHDDDDDDDDDTMTMTTTMMTMMSWRNSKQWELPASKRRLSLPLICQPATPLLLFNIIIIWWCFLWWWFLWLWWCLSQVKLGSPFWCGVGSRDPLSRQVFNISISITITIIFTIVIIILIIMIIMVNT